MAHIQKRCLKCQGSIPAHTRICPKCGASDSAWRARYRGPDGRERSKTFDRKADAENWLTGRESAKLRGEWIDPTAGRIRLIDFATEWMAGVVHLRPSTRNRYQSLLKVHIEPALGQAPLSMISPHDVRGFASAMLQAGLSPT